MKNNRDAADIAALAWNSTKDDADPEFPDCAPGHQGKLLTAVTAIEETGSAGIQGLEAFEEEVKRLLKEAEPPAALVVVEKSAKSEPKSTAKKAGKK